MSAQLSRIDETHLAETLDGMTERLSRREAAGALVWSVLPALAWMLLALTHPLGHLPLVPAALCLVVLVVALRVQIDLPLGFTVPTQLAYVPLVFAVPPLLAPPLVLVALLGDRLVEIGRGRYSTSRLLHAAGNATFTLGPATVFVLSGTDARHASLLLLGTALLAQFLVDFAVSSAGLSLARAVSFAEQLRDTWIYLVDAVFALAALAVAEQTPHRPLLVLSLLPLLGLLGVFAAERRKRLESTLELSAAYRGTALVLGDVIEADDGYTGEHSQGVVALAVAVGEELDVSSDRQRNLEFGALLHDVGKVAIPKQILNKPGKLDPHEWTIIKTHTLEGQRMLDRVGGFMREVGKIVRSHHERWDGGGYPDGLAGETIPIEARIITACDAWNAMRTDRSYRQALAFETALSEIVAGSGSQFDPAVVNALLRVVSRDVALALAGRPGPTGPTAGDPTAALVEPPARAVPALSRPDR